MEQAFQTIARNALKQVGRGWWLPSAGAGSASSSARADSWAQFGLSHSFPQLRMAPCMPGAVRRAVALTLAFLPFPPARKPKWSFTMNSPNPSN